MGIVINLRHERFAQALAQGKAANEAYALSGYKANDGNASRLKGNERISARVQEIVGPAAERAEISLECILREGSPPAEASLRNAVHRMLTNLRQKVLHQSIEDFSPLEIDRVPTVGYLLNFRVRHERGKRTG